MDIFDLGQIPLCDAGVDDGRLAGHAGDGPRQMGLRLICGFTDETVREWTRSAP